MGKEEESFPSARERDSNAFNTHSQWYGESGFGRAKQTPSREAGRILVVLKTSIQVTSGFVWFGNVKQWISWYQTYEGSALGCDHM